MKVPSFVAVSLLFVSIAAVPMASAAPAKKNSKRVHEVPQAQQVREVIRANIKDVQECYKTSFPEGSRPTGKLTLDWQHEASGRIARISVNAGKSSITEPKLGDCLIARMKTWAWTPSSDGRTTGVSYPFIFENGGLRDFRD